MKTLHFNLILIGVIVGVSISMAAPVAAQKPTGFTQETYTANGFATTVVDDHKRGVTCYHTIYNPAGSYRPTSSCVKVK